MSLNSIPGWLLVVARNLIVKEWARGARNLASLDHRSETFDEIQIGLPTEAGTLQTQDLVWEILEAMPPEKASSLILKYMWGFTAKELALRGHSSVPAVEQRIKRAKSEFQRLYFQKILTNNRPHDEPKG